MEKAELKCESNSLGCLKRRRCYIDWRELEKRADSRMMVVSVDSDWELHKKTEEGRFIKEALCYCLGFAIDASEPDTRERQEEPDVYLTLQSSSEGFRMGCEVTRVLVTDPKSGSKTRKFRGFWSKLFDDIEKERSGRPLPRALVAFRDSISNFRPARDEIKEELKRAGALLEREIEIELSPDDSRFPNLAKSISWIRRQEHKQDLRWWPIDLKSGEVSDLVPYIQSSYLQKCRRGLKYSWDPCCDGKLLLLVAEGLGLDDIAVVRGPFDLSTDVKCPFDWVWLFDRFSGKVWQLYPDFQNLCKSSGRNGSIIYRSCLPSVLRRFVEVSSG